jgi:glycosyl transferase family 25
MDIWVINLAQDTDRLGFMAKQLREFGLKFRRHEAVWGKSAQGDDATFRDAPSRAHLSAAEIGCVLSHVRLWERIVREPAPFALVLEDDVHFARDFGNFVRHLHLDANDLEIHRLETFLARVTTQRTPSQRIGHRRAFKLLTNHGGAAAYVLNRRTAAHLLKAVDCVVHPPDIALFDPERRAVHDVSIYQWTPAPCIQDMLVKGAGTRQRFASHLAPDRYDVRAGILKTEHGLAAAIKQAARPIYTAIYAAALAPVSKTRQLVAFG